MGQSKIRPGVPLKRLDATAEDICCIMFHCCPTLKTNKEKLRALPIFFSGREGRDILEFWGCPQVKFILVLRIQEYLICPPPKAAP